MADTMNEKRSYRAGEGHPRAGAGVGDETGHTASSSIDCGSFAVDHQAVAITLVTGEEKKKGVKEEKEMVVSEGEDSDIQWIEQSRQDRKQEEQRRKEGKKSKRKNTKEDKKQENRIEEKITRKRTVKGVNKDKIGKEIKKEAIEAQQESGSGSDKVRKPQPKKKKIIEVGERSWVEDEEESTDTLDSEWDSDVDSEDMGKVWDENTHIAEEMKRRLEKEEKEEKWTHEERMEAEEELAELVREKIWKEIDEELATTDITEENRTKHMIWQSKKIEYMEKACNEMRKKLEEYKEKVDGQSKMKKGKMDTKGKESNKEAENKIREMERKWDKDIKRMKEEWEKDRKRERDILKMEIDLLKKDARKDAERARSELHNERDKWMRMAEVYRKGKEQMEKDMAKLKEIAKTGNQERQDLKQWEKTLQEREDKIKKEREEVNRDRARVIRKEKDWVRKTRGSGVEMMEVEEKTTVKENRGTQTEKTVTYKEVLEKNMRGDRRERNATEERGTRRQTIQEEDTEQEWSTVNRRGGNKKKTGPGQRTRQTRMRREAIIIVPKEGEKGDEIMRHFTGVCSEETAEEISKVRETKKGDILIEMEYRGELDKMKRKIEEVISDRATIIKKRPTMEIEIDDIDTYLEEEEIEKRVQEELCGGVIEESEIRKKVIKKLGNGTRRAVFEVPMLWRTRILEMGSIRIGLTKCSIREAKRVVRCFKCHDIGHLSYFCKRNPEGMEICRRCGDTGHDVKMCGAIIRCHVCMKRGVPGHRLGHYAGTYRCMREKELLESRGRQS